MLNLSFNILSIQKFIQIQYICCILIHSCCVAMATLTCIIVTHDSSTVTSHQYCNPGQLNDIIINEVIAIP